MFRWFSCGLLNMCGAYVKFPKGLIDSNVPTSHKKRRTPFGFEAGLPVLLLFVENRSITMHCCLQSPLETHGCVKKASKQVSASFPVGYERVGSRSPPLHRTSGGAPSEELATGVPRRSPAVSFFNARYRRTEHDLQEAPWGLETRMLSVLQS